MLASILRTVVPLIVGWLLSLAIFQAVDVESLTELVTAGVTAVYYVIVRLLEGVDSRFGWLLGYAAAPVYAKPSEAAAGLAPVPPSEVVAQVAQNVVKEWSHGEVVPTIVAGPASAIPNGTRVEVVPTAPPDRFGHPMT